MLAGVGRGGVARDRDAMPQNGVIIGERNDVSLVVTVKIGAERVVGMNSLDHPIGFLVESGGSEKR